MNYYLYIRPKNICRILQSLCIATFLSSQCLATTSSSAPLTDDPTTSKPIKGVNTPLGTVDYKQIRGTGDKKIETVLQVPVYTNLSKFDLIGLKPLDLKTYTTENFDGVRTGHVGFRVNTFATTKNMIAEVMQVVASENFDPTDPTRLSMCATLMPFLSLLDPTLKDPAKATPSIDTLIAQIFAPSKSQSSYPLVVMFPGSAGIRASEEINAAMIAQRLNAIVFMPDLVRSFGTSTLADQLKQSIYGCGFSVWSSIAHAQKIPGTDPTKTGVVGDSLGALGVWMSLQPSIRSKVTSLPPVVYYDLGDLPRVITEGDAIAKLPTNVRMTIRHGSLDNFFEERDLADLKNGLSGDHEVKFVTYPSHHDGKAHKADFPDGPATVDNATKYAHLAITIKKPLADIKRELLDIITSTLDRQKAVDAVMGYMGNTAFFSLNKPMVETTLGALKDLLSKLDAKDTRLQDKLGSSGALLQMINDVGLGKQVITFSDIPGLLANLPKGATFGPGKHAQEIRNDVVYALGRHLNIPLQTDAAPTTPAPAASSSTPAAAPAKK